MPRIKRHATVISTNIRRKKNGVKSLKSDQKLFALTVFFIVGLVLGACFVKYSSCKSTESLSKIIVRSFTAMQEQNLFQCSLLYAKVEMLYTASAFTFGACLLGEPILWAFPFVKGFLLGTVSGYLYSVNSLSGMTFFSAILLLPSVVSTASFLIGCKESILTVRDLDRAVFQGQKDTAGKEMLKLYLLRYCILCIGILFASILFGVLFSLFHAKFPLIFPA